MSICNHCSLTSFHFFFNLEFTQTPKKVSIFKLKQTIMYKLRKEESVKFFAKEKNLTC